MTHKHVIKGLIVFTLNVAIALAGGALNAQDDNGLPGIDKAPYPMHGGRYIMLHDDEIVAIATPPPGISTTNHLVGWTFYPDEDLNLTEHDLDLKSLKPDMGRYSYYGQSATTTGRMHSSTNEEVFVVYFTEDHYLHIYAYDPATGETGMTVFDGTQINVKCDLILAHYIDCATGDVDGDSWDELIVVYPWHDESGYFPHLLLFAKGEDMTVNLKDSHIDTDLSLHYEHNVAVATGDLDGDGDSEIVLAAEGAEYLHTVAAYDTINPISFTKIDALTILNDKEKDRNSIDIATGDFDGDGNHEIVVCSSYNGIDLIDLNGDRELERLQHVHDVDPRDWKENHIAVGDLDGDGDDEAVTARQIYEGNAEYIEIFLYDFDNSLNMTEIKQDYGSYPPLITNADPGAGAFDIAIGNFDGEKDIPNEVVVAYSTLMDSDLSGNNYWPAIGFMTFDVNLSLELVDQKFHWYNVDHTYVGVTDGWSPRVVIAAGDFDNDSVILGTPDHWVIEGHQDFSAILAEPPKHIDYMKDIKEDLTELNVSRYGGAPNTTELSWYTEFTDCNKTAIETTDKSTFDSNFAVGFGLDISRKFKIPLIETIKVKVKAGAEWSWNKHREAWNNKYQSTTVGVDLQALNDDYLVYRSKDIHIWRYPVIGETAQSEDSGEEGQVYIQMTFPSDAKTHTLEGATVEWYQPPHENGNLLSYPWDQKHIESLGDIKTVIGDYSTGGDAGSYYIEWDTEEEDGTEISSSKKVATDDSISAEGKIFNFKTKLSLKFHYDKTMGQLKTSVTTNSKSKGISIYKCPLEVNYAYHFTPLIYENSKLGVLQVGHTVDLLDTTAISWWKTNYNNLPDLALNLPYRWNSENHVDWTFNQGGMNLQSMKGLFLLDEQGKQFGQSIEEGQQVTVRARIYNYSLVDLTQPVVVSIEAQASTDNDNWGEPFEVGRVEINELLGFQNSADKANWKYAEVTFDTTGKAGQYYRFWVTVDPDDTITEVTGHDNGDYYENNTGYFGMPMYVEAETEAVASPEGDLFHEEISVSDEAPKMGEQVIVTDRISVTGGDFKQVYVCFYEGNPDDGGKMFDIELIPYIAVNTPYTVRVPYNTYGKVGEKEIHAVITGKIGEYDYGNNEVVAQVTISTPPETWRDEVMDLLLGK
jgi:hypothetical protein